MPSIWAREFHTGSIRVYRHMRVGSVASENQAIPFTAQGMLIFPLLYPDCAQKSILGTSQKSRQPKRHHVQPHLGCSLIPSLASLPAIRVWL
jgi:hypothetical protein